MKDNCSLYNLCSFYFLDQNLLKEFANDVRAHRLQGRLMAFEQCYSLGTGQQQLSLMGNSLNDNWIADYFQG